jgi:hypothetical protein
MRAINDPLFSLDFTLNIKFMTKTTNQASCARANTDEKTFSPSHTSSNHTNELD